MFVCVSKKTVARGLADGRATTHWPDIVETMPGFYDPECCVDAHLLSMPRKREGRWGEGTGELRLEYILYFLHREIVYRCSPRVLSYARAHTMANAERCGHVGNQLGQASLDGSRRQHIPKPAKIE